MTMDTEVYIEKNQAGGYDLLTERDRGNPVRILTGKPSHSLEYYKQLRVLCDRAITLMDGEDRGRNS